MPRSGSGLYTLPTGNPVVGGTVVTSTWANTTMDDVSLALTDSLDRNGRGGMLAPFRIADGNRIEPGYAWTAETSSGLYRANPGEMRVAMLSTDVMRWRPSGTDVWDADQMEWVSIGAIGGRNGLTVVPTVINTTGLVGRHYHITVGAVTVTLPAVPVAGDVIGVSVDNFATNIIDSNGKPINGVIQNIEMDLVDLSLTLQYVDDTIGWEVRSQALSSAVTGGLPAAGTGAGNTLVWDTTSERWVETNFLNVGLDQVVSGLVNGDVPDQKLTRLTVVAALPGTPAENAVYLIPGGGIYLEDVLIAGTGWEAGGAAESIINSNTGDVVMAPADGDVDLIPILGDVDITPAAGDSNINPVLGDVIIAPVAGNILMTTLPVADPLVSGALWSNSGVLTVSA